MNPYVQANTDGRLHPANEPSISPLNRGFLYGDAIYEVWRSYHGVLFAWEQHWQRFHQSAAALYFDPKLTQAEILTQIRKTSAAFRRQTRVNGDLYVRLQVSRSGGGAIGLDPALAESPSYVILVQENKVYSPEKFAAGLVLSLAKDLKRNSPETLNPAWKTGNYLNNILCLREARLRGADEVLICNQRGEITEAAVSNVAFVRDQEIITPSLDQGILGGITRQLMVEEIAPANNLKVVERAIRPEELKACSECFLLSTTKDITPVARIDDTQFKVGENTVTLRLKNAFARYIEAYAKLHSAWQVDE